MECLGASPNENGNHLQWLPASNKTMIDISSTAEDVLDQYWLLVWRHLVEIHWNDVRDYDCYSFFQLRQNKCRPKESIDAEVADLAIDYWKRNRFKLKEHFINLTCELWPNKETSVYKDLHNGWIDCGVNPAFPNISSKYTYSRRCDIYNFFHILIHFVIILNSTSQLGAALTLSSFDGAKIGSKIRLLTKCREYLSQFNN